MAGFFDGEKHGPAIASLMATGIAAMQDERAPQNLGQAVKKSAWRAWGIVAATLLVIAGAGLLLAGVFLALEPVLGSAAAMIVISLLPLATGIGIFLRLRT